MFFCIGFFLRFFLKINLKNIKLFGVRIKVWRFVEGFLIIFCLYKYINFDVWFNFFLKKKIFLLLRKR